MGEDVIDRAAALVGLAQSPSKTADLRLHGWSQDASAGGDWKQVYGSDLPRMTAIDQNLAKPLHPALPFQQLEVIWAMRYEMARTVEDVLARRTRALFMDARASIEAAPLVARLLGDELGQDELWQHKQVAAFDAVAEQYVWSD
jgi:glycerol-3-phosphate dehydrogenase